MPKKWPAGSARSSSACGTLFMERYGGRVDAVNDDRNAPLPGRERDEWLSVKQTYAIAQSKKNKALS